MFDMEFCKRAKDQTGTGGGGNTGGGGGGSNRVETERYPNFIKMGNSTRLPLLTKKNKKLRWPSFKNSPFNVNFSESYKLF